MAEQAETTSQERAEELVERLSQDVGRFFERLVARAREEGEDIWAEAAEMRHGTSSAPEDRP